MPTTLANPHRFMTLTAPLVPALLVAGGILIAAGVPMALNAPADFRQGQTARIMFIHVPAAWMALAAYTALAGASLTYLIYRTPIADIAASAIAPPGAILTLICLATGSIWGKPVWNTWWEWDARLTSVLALFFIFLACIALRNAHHNPSRAAGPCAVLAVVGAINLPVVKFSVDWWNTLHQPASILRTGGPAMPAEYLLPLAIMALGLGCVLAGCVLAAMQAEILIRRADALRMRYADS